jgi:uncharacterized protein (TIRG00374 family)
VRLKRILITVAKLTFSALLIGFLIFHAARDPQFGELVTGPKNWPLLVATIPIFLAAVVITIFRWHFLLRALGLTFSLGESLRAGFIGYLANLLPFGLVAGDSLKAVMLIHRNKQRKTEAVASVLVDRVLGLYALLLLATGASMFLPEAQLARLLPADRATIVNLCWFLRLAAVVGSIGLAIMLVPGVTQSRLWDLLEHTPLIGRMLHKLVGAMRAYRRRVDLLLAAVGVSLVIHLCYASAIVVVSRSIGIAPQHQPPIGAIYTIVPPSMMAGALPIGVYEVTITLLFRAVSPPGAPQNMGLLIGLGYRLVQILIATIGVGYWLAGRREVREIIHEAEETPLAEELSGDEPVAAARA